VAAGALALFGEKYGDEVRVLAMGEEAGRPYSVELCGGTHVGALGEIGLFVITGESAVSSGIRRIEALTGEAARLWLTGRDRLVQSLAQMVKTAPGELLDRVAAILDERKQLDSALADARQQLALGGGGGQGASDNPLETVGGVALSVRVLHGLEAKALRGLIDQEKQRMGSGIAAFIAVNDGRAAVAVGVTDDLTASHDAVALVKIAVAALGGQGGGGRPDMAQGGGPDAAAADSALAALRAHLGG
jgi:alanyl-tRNA synthetase